MLTQHFSPYKPIS